MGGRVQPIDAEYAGIWELEVLGEVTAPAAVLVRPDEYVAWAGDLTTWGSLTRSPPSPDRLLQRSAKVHLRLTECCLSTTTSVSPGAGPPDFGPPTRPQPHPP